MYIWMCQISISNQCILILQGEQNKRRWTFKATDHANKPALDLCMIFKSGKVYIYISYTYYTMCVEIASSVSFFTYSLVRCVPLHHWPWTKSTYPSMIARGVLIPWSWRCILFNVQIMHIEFSVYTYHHIFIFEFTHKYTLYM